MIFPEAQVYHLPRDNVLRHCRPATGVPLPSFSAENRGVGFIEERNFFEGYAHYMALS